MEVDECDETTLHDDDIEEEACPEVMIHYLVKESCYLCAKPKLENLL